MATLSYVNTAYKQSSFKIYRCHTINMHIYSLDYAIRTRNIVSLNL